MVPKNFKIGNKTVKNIFLGSKRHLYPIDQNVLRNHINSSISSRLANKNSATDRLVYSSRDPYFGGLGKFVRNPSCWLNGVSNISCFSPAQMSGSLWYQRSGTLITTKHVSLTIHFRPSILPNGGTPLIFVDDNNNVVRRNLIAINTIPNTDICVGLLDDDVPNNIKIAKVLPPDYQSYIGYPSSLLSLMLDAQEKASIKNWSGLLNTMTANGLHQLVYILNLQNTSPYYGFTETIVVGDSNNPIFIIIDNELILLGQIWTNVGGSFITTRYNDVNNSINILSPNEGYGLTAVDLDSIYRKYYNS